MSFSYGPGLLTALLTLKDYRLTGLPPLLRALLDSLHRLYDSSSSGFALGNGEEFGEVGRALASQMDLSLQLWLPARSRQP